MASGIPREGFQLLEACRQTRLNQVELHHKWLCAVLPDDIIREMQDFQIALDGNSQRTVCHEPLVTNGQLNTDIMNTLDVRI